MPLRKAAKDMRDLYANEIARAIHKGVEPSQYSIDAWAKYDAELASLEAGEKATS